MKKIALTLLNVICVISFVFGIAGCSSTDDGEGADMQITGITFEDKVVTYNGQEHFVLINGTLPSGVEVAYVNNVGTNANVYNATATLSGEGYVTKTLNAKLTINKANYDMSSAVWSAADFTYDGTQKSVTVSGLPNGVSVKQYSNNTATNANNYVASVTFNYDTVNYNAPSVSNYNWQIKKANFTGVVFNGETFDYDGNEKSIEVQGIPNDSNVIYECENVDGIENNATEIGTYHIIATITNPNFNELVLEADLVISGSEDERHIYMHGDTLYFANALHDDYLYAYNGESVSLISYDVPYNFTEKDGVLYLRSKSLFGGAVKEIKIAIDSTNVDSVADVKGEYLTTDGTNFYYVVNSLTQAKSGIYKLTIPSGEEPVITLLTTGKAKYLQYYDGYLYFADGENGYKLSKVSVNGGVKTLVRDEKINNLIAENGYLFYTVNNLLGDYIENYKISTNTYKKLTIDAGANLTLIGNKLYYINVDLLTSYVNGDGIYYVNAYPLTDNQLPGSKLVGDATFSSLTAISNNEIAYYKITNTQELLIHNLDNNETTNVLEGFVKPESIPLSTGSKMLAYDGLVYYLDLYKGKVLYSYNPSTQKTRKITANKVSDFAIIGDYLYYNAISTLVDNNLYCINLKTGGEPEKVSTYDANDIVFDGNNVFYVEKNAGGVRTAIRKVSADGTDPIIYSHGVNNLRYYNGYIYFIDGDDLYRMPTTNYTVDSPELLRSGDVDVFEINEGVIYFREVLIINKQLSKINVDGTGYAVVKTGYDPVDICIHDGYIYFYSDTIKASTAGIFKIAISGGEVTQIILKTTNSTTYYPSEIVICGENIYFVNYALGGVGGDSHVYKVNLTSKEIEKVI
ncbi:MAG: DUF5050 domain-containing protein [Clostridia bacterium]|nr:DUF5050 domain-containing protein [Clostridia bacterium]